MSLRETTKECGADAPNCAIGLTPATARRWNDLDRVRARTAWAPQHDSCGMATRATCHGFSLQAGPCSTFVALTSQTRLVDCCSPHPRADPLIRVRAWKALQLQADRWAGVSDRPSLWHPEVKYLWHKPPSSQTLPEIQISESSVHQRLTHQTHRESE